ncbi:MAG: hypothetical protein ACK4N5_19120 [Myxococcales bacterium]
MVFAEGPDKRLVEMQPDGKVVAVNSTDFTGFDWALNLTTDSAGNVYVIAFRKVFRYEGGVNTTKVEFLPQAGNQSLDAIAWGGPNGGTFYAVRGGKLVKFANPTATSAGTGVELTGALPINGLAKGLAVTSDGTAYVYSSNACRLIRVTDAGDVTILIGSQTGSGVCPFAGNEPPPNELAQGAGLALRNGRLVVGESGANAVREIDLSTTPPTLRVLAKGIAANDVAVAPDGSVWAVEDGNGKIFKLSF